MIDWGNVFENGLWLIGLALILAALSFGDYIRTEARLPAGSIWRAILFWARVGGLLLCAGMALTVGSWLERGLWALLGLGVIYEWWRWRGRSASGLAEVFALRKVSAKPNLPPTSIRHSHIRTVAEWLVRFELLWLALLSPFFIFPAPNRLLPLAALPALWIARRIARGHFIRRTPLDWAIALLMLMVLVSLYATFDISFSLGKVSGVLFGIGVYYALVEWAAIGSHMRWSLVAYVLGGVTLAGVGLLGINWTNKLPVLSQVTSHLPAVVRGLPGAEGGIQSNEVAGSLLWVIPVQLALFWWSWLDILATPRRWLLRLGLLLTSLLCGGTLLLTQSRSALIGFIAGLALLMWLAGVKVRLFLAAILVIGVVATVYVGPAKLAGKLTDAVGPGANAAAGINSVIDRTEIWSRAIYGIEDFPFTGMGMNAFRHVMPILYPMFSVALDTDFGHAHNHLLQAALDLGLPGLVAYLAIYMVAAALVVLVWRSASPAWNKAVAAGVGAGLLAYFVYGMTDAVALGAKPSIFFWALLALLVTAWQQAMKHDVDVPQVASEIELTCEKQLTLV